MVVVAVIASVGVASWARISEVCTTVRSNVSQFGIMTIREGLILDAVATPARSSNVVAR